MFCSIRFSTDEGQCWHVYNFTQEPLYFTGLAWEPGARSMNISIWGYRDQENIQSWVSVTIDFRELLTRDCKYNIAILLVNIERNDEVVIPRNVK